MADYRPYRTANTSAQAKLARVKRISLSVFFTAVLVISWQTTQETARRFQYQATLGAPLFGHIYTPWAWISWWVRWHAYPGMEQAAFQALYPLLAVGILVAGAIIIARKMLTDDVPDSHGSARWANDEEVRTSGLIATIPRLPRWLRRLAIRSHLMKRPPARDGIYLGVWKPRRRGRGSYLRDCGSGHVFGFAPTRAGKGVSTIIPTLTTWRHSALIHDFKGELWEQTAGARKQMGQVCLKFNPTDKNGCVKYNPLEEVRIGTDDEVADVQNIVQMLIDPEGKGFGDDHWKETAAPLFTGAIELAFVSGFLALVVGAAFLIVAVELMLTLVKAYLTTSLGVILLGFGGNRFTASAAEGYFTNVIRIGTRLLFFYAVLAVGMQMVVQWQAALLAACAPAPTAVSMIHSYYVPPSSVIVSACTGTITLDQMLGYAALAVVFATISVAVPSMAAELVGGTVGLAIAHAFEAAYTAQTIAKIVNPITQLGAAITGRDKNKATSSQDRFAMDSVVSNQQRDSAATAAASATTKVLNPNNGRPPGYNLRPTTLLNPDRSTSPIAKPGSSSTVSIVQTAPKSAQLNGGKKTSI